MPESIASGRPLKAIIRPAAFKQNIELVESLCPQSKVLVVIKADGYGHGMAHMARAAGPDRSLAVATPDEAGVLLDAGIGNDIWVLEGPFGAPCLELSQQSTQVVWIIHSQWQLDLMCQAGASRAGYRIWLKLDTGMHRLGFQRPELSAALASLQASDMFQLEGVMTHFSSSEVPAHAGVREQIKHFDAMLASSGLQGQPLSLCNSAAIIHYPECHEAWVRPGISLYGGFSSASTPYAPVMSLVSEVMALRYVEAGESVGYGDTWAAPRRTLIATVAVGYGDGYPRHARNGTPVLVNGQRASLAGRVSMDMITVDVTDLAEPKIGDKVELWGEQLSIDEVAACADTISYELLTQVTARVPRVYC